MESVKRKMEIECPHCGKSFEPRGAEPPRTCPKCRSPYWDRPRKQRSR